MKAPSGLAARGRAFWSQAVDTYELTESELSLLIEVCRLMDECEALCEAIAADGTTVAGSNGQPRFIRRSVSFASTVWRSAACSRSSLCRTRTTPPFRRRCRPVGGLRLGSGGPGT